MLQPGEVLLDRYEIRNLIGQGGMSTVYRVRERNTGQVRAIKDVKRSASDHNQIVEQSLAVEGRMLMQLSHPRLPRIYEIIEEYDSIMLVMDFIQGESLDKVLIREGAQTVQRTLDWGMQLCEVFHYLHSQTTPIIYRDMKPANVMLQQDGQLKMIDFGTARTQKIGVTMQADTVCIGTEGFAAPEQFGGIGQSTARTDIYCLGATLYNMVTGHSPCDKPTGILPLEMWNPALANTPIAEIIAKCTRKDPDARYQTALELHEDLRLASIGAYQMENKRRGNVFTAALGKGGFQHQEHGTGGIITGGLTDLFRKGTGPLTLERPASPTEQIAPAHHPDGMGWNMVQPHPLRTQMADEEQPERSVLQNLFLICMAASVVFVILTLILAVMSQTAEAAVFLIIGLLTMAAAMVCMIFSRRE